MQGVTAPRTHCKQNDTGSARSHHWSCSGSRCNWFSTCECNQKGWRKEGEPESKASYNCDQRVLEEAAWTHFCLSCRLCKWIITDLKSQQLFITRRSASTSTLRFDIETSFRHIYYHLCVNALFPMKPTDLVRHINVKRKHKSIWALRVLRTRDEPYQMTEREVEWDTPLPCYLSRFEYLPLT